MGLFEDFFGDRGTDERKSCFKDLVALVCADGRIDPREKALLLIQGRKCGLNQKEIEEVMSNPSAIRFVPPSDLKERIAHLLDMVVMMLVDRNIDPREMDLCKKLARALGFNPLIVDKMVSDIVGLLEKGQPRNKVEVQLEEFLRGAQL